ncbi:hypothetical protein GmHk_01G001117 [Glycine max]|nr:hypothetical protein GmHk_01G001117 [Glycine max]
MEEALGLLLLHPNLCTLLTLSKFFYILLHVYCFSASSLLHLKNNPKFDEFKEELEKCHWDEKLTDFSDSSIDIAIMKEFYANLYDPDDKSPKQVRVKGHLVKFDDDTLNTFLKTPVVLEEGENLCTYSRFALLRPDPQELAAKLCIPGRGFELNADGQPLKILRKNMTTLAQTWNILSFSNLIPTSHTSDVTLDKAKLIYGIIMKMDMNLGYLISHQISLIAQHDTSRLGFLALITTLCKARGVQSNSRSLENLSPAINLAYIKKNCWNLDDPTVTFRGPRKARGKRSEVPTTSAPPETPASSSSTTPVPFSTLVIPPTPTQRPLPAPLSVGPSDFIFTPLMLHFMLQSIYRGQSIIMQSLQGLGLPSIMSMEEFDVQVAWPGVQPSPSGGGWASTAQEPAYKEPTAVAADGEDELTPPEPFYFNADAHMVQEEGTSTDQIPEPSPALVPKETQPSTPITELEQPIQDSSAAPARDLSEDQPQDEQDI